MKKLSTFLLLAGLSSMAFSAGNVNLRVGVDAYSKTGNIGEYSSGSAEDVGFEAGVEYMRNFGKRFQFGVGVGYQKHAKLQGNNHDWEIGNFKENYEGFGDFNVFDSVPLYVTGRFTPIVSLPIRPYIKMSFGYSFNFSNDSIGYSQGWKYDDDYFPSYPGNVAENKFDSYSLSTKINDGLYYAVGVGVEYSIFGVEALYQLNTGKLDINNPRKGSNSYDVDYHRFSILFNVKF